MEVIFKTDDPIEAKRLAKATDMALFIHDLVINGWKEFKHSDYDYEPAWEKIGKLLDEYKINIDDLIE